MNAAPDCLTVLRSRGAVRLAKRLHPDGCVEDYDDARTLDAFTVPVPDHHDRLAPAAVPGGLLRHPWRAAARRTRNRHPAAAASRQEDGATFRDVPRRWLALDVEGVPLPPELPASDLTERAAVALARLPAELHGAACIVQASASHGLKPDLRLRLWFCLDRPTWGHELRRWMSGTPCDPSVFGAVQPIYTAAPVLAPDMVDPLPARLLALPGRPVVAVPAPELLAPPPAPERSTFYAVATPERAHAYVRAALVQAAVRISTTQHPGRHPSIVAETSRLARFVGPGLLSEAVIADVVRDAARQAGKDDDGEISAAIAWGLANPWTAGPVPEPHHGR